MAWLRTLGPPREPSATIAVLTGRSAKVNGVAINGHGSPIASAGADGTVRLWDASTRVMSSAADGSVWAVAFTPEGRSVVSA